MDVVVVAVVDAAAERGRRKCCVIHLRPWRTEREDIMLSDTNVGNCGNEHSALQSHKP